MGRIYYDSKLIQPAGFLNINKTYNETSDGEKIGEVYNITLNGTLVAYKGSPTSSGTFWTVGGNPPDEVIGDTSRLAAMLAKQEALHTLFCNEGRQFDVQPLDGSQSMRFNPRINSVGFQEGPWYNTCQYSVSMEADQIYLGNSNFCETAFTEKIEDANENWSIETNEDAPEGLEIPRTYRFSHNVSARGKRFYNDAGVLEKPAWQQARDWVLPRLGFDSVIALSSGVNNLPDYYQGYNYIRNEQINELGGNYSVNETWVLASGNAIEEFTVQLLTPQEGYEKVTINGSIRGLETRDNDMKVTSTKWENADTKWSGVLPLIFTRAQAYAEDLNLNPVVLTSTIGKNPINGTLQYTYEYDTRPTNLITDTKSEAISIQNSWDVDVVAAVGVLGRARGPVLQGLGSHRELTRSLSIELVFNSSYIASGDSIGTRLNDRNPRFNSPQSSEIQAIVDSANPVLAGVLNNVGEAATTAYVVDQNENWDISRLAYSYNLTYIYE